MHNHFGHNLKCIVYTPASEIVKVTKKEVAKATTLVLRHHSYDLLLNSAVQRSKPWWWEKFSWHFSDSNKKRSKNLTTASQIAILIYSECFLYLNFLGIPRSSAIEIVVAKKIFYFFPSRCLDERQKNTPHELSIKKNAKALLIPSKVLSSRSKPWLRAQIQICWVYGDSK